MAVLDDELMKDAEYDADVVAYVREQIPQELKEKFSDDELYYFHDLVEDYLAESAVFEAEPDEEGFVDIDIEDIAKHLQKVAKKEAMGNYELEDLLRIVDAELFFCDDEDEE